MKRVHPGETDTTLFNEGGGICTSPHGVERWPQSGHGLLPAGPSGISALTPGKLRRLTPSPGPLEAESAE